MKDDQNDKKLELLKNQCRVLMQSFDSVQIFATKFDADGNGGTGVFSYGDGNWFARYGQIHKWLVEENYGKPPEEME